MSLILAAALVTTIPAATSQPSLDAVAQELHGELQTGTLIVNEGDCLAVKVFTGSPYTHVGSVVVRHGQPFVYDSMNGAGVRCQTLENYLKAMSPDEIHLFQPTEPFTTEQAEQFEAYLDSQLGRPYGIKHHLTGKRAEGVHCAEYTVDALQACGLMHAKNPPRVSPASLVKGVQKAGIYRESAVIELKTPIPPPPADIGWCARLWLDTKNCTSHCCAQLRGWFLCR